MATLRREGGVQSLVYEWLSTLAAMKEPARPSSAEPTSSQV